MGACVSSTVSAAGDGATSSSTIVAETATRAGLFSIEGYSRTKGLGNGISISSGRLEVGGHHWFIRYYPDGNGATNAGWISLVLCLDMDDPDRAGAKDDDVMAGFHFSLLDLDGKPVPSRSAGSSSVRTFFSATAGPRQWGFDRFIARAELERSAYLRDDCFSIRCDVTVVVKGVRTAEAEAEAAAGKFVVVPPSDLHEDLGRLLAAKAGADVTFEVGGEAFAAHRSVLAARSSVFMAELFGPSRDKTATCVRIDDMEAKAFEALLHFIYTDSLPETDRKQAAAMAQHLLVAAYRYNLERLKLMCEGKLCKHMDTAMAATSLALAEQHGCHGLKEACFKFLRSRDNLKAVMASDGFEHLASSCPSLLKELLAEIAP